MESLKGKIIKGIGGFYYVNAADRVYECKARGVFRKDGRKPLVGDDVRMEVLDEEKMLGSVEELLPRRSELVRPAVANVDQALIIFAVASPQPSLNLLDRFLIHAKVQGVPALICFNKEDLSDGEALAAVYRSAGYEVLKTCALTGEGVEELRRHLQGRTTTVAGPSGVGKSTLINALAGRDLMETGDVSRKIERGKHTTRHSELFRIGEDTYLFDTPGFTSLEVFGVTKESLWTFYPEFAEPEKSCRFAQCSHLHEPDCGVREAVETGEITRERYENYRLLYEELSGRKSYGKGTPS